MFTAAHEAAHIVQQESGVQLPDGVGQAGDKYEQHANDIGGRVERGESVAHLLGAASTSGGQPEGEVQRKEDDSSSAIDVVEPDDVQAGVRLRFKGLKLHHLVPRVAVPPDELPPYKDLVKKLAMLRPLEPHYAASALTSVQGRPEMSLNRGMRDTDTGSHLELPAAYLGDPPTLQVASFIGLHFAVAVIEWLIAESEKRMNDKTLRIEQIGGKPIHATKRKLDAYRWSLIAQQTLGGLTGSFGGVIGFMVSTWLGASPKQVAGATQLGENALGALAYAKHFAPKRGQAEPGKEGKPKTRDIPRTRHGPKKTPRGTKPSSLKRMPFETPHGHEVEVVTRGKAVVPTGKVERYIRGRSIKFTRAMKQELKDLKHKRQTGRKDFDKNPENAKRVRKLQGLKKNYDRSQEMNKTLKGSGLKDVPVDNETIMSHLLDIGQGINKGNRVRHASVLDGPDGSIKILSTWTILPDGRPYLSTLNLIPIDKR